MQQANERPQTNRQTETDLRETGQASASAASLGFAPSERTSARSRRATSSSAGQGRGLQLVSAKTLAQEWDCAVSTVHRLLERAGVRPYYLHDGRNGTKRFRREEVNEYLNRSTII